MKIAFALYKYFPYGGLQKDMLAIARECASRKHEVRIFCRHWSGEKPAGIDVEILPVHAFSNDGKNHRFNTLLVRRMSEYAPDLLVAFNKIPGADVYYAADTCFKAKLYEERPWLYRFLPRYRNFIREESALFANNNRIRTLALSNKTIDEYRRYYNTDANCFTLLPPGIARDRINSSGERHYALHKELGLTEDRMIVLMVGSGFRTKGLDRAITALASLPTDLKANTHLVVVGEDTPRAFEAQAQQHGLEEQLHFLGGRKDVPELLRSADILIHPAYREAAGMALLEAAVACLPVLTTDVCGYAHYISENNLGVVLESPYKQQQLNSALLEMLTDATKIKQWRNNGKRFASTADIYDMPQKAADVIENAGKQRKVM